MARHRWIASEATASESESIKRAESRFRRIVATDRCKCGAVRALIERQLRNGANGTTWEHVYLLGGSAGAKPGSCGDHGTEG